MIKSFRHRGLKRLYEQGDASRIGADQKGAWSVRITGNWRITFRFEDGDAYGVDLVDYH